MGGFKNDYKNNEVITSAVSTIYEITQDQKLVEYIRARDERIAVENRFKKEAAEAKAETAEVKKQLAKSEQRIAELEEELRKAQGK